MGLDKSSYMGVAIICTNAKKTQKSVQKTDEYMQDAKGRHFPIGTKFSPHTGEQLKKVEDSWIEVYEETESLYDILYDYYKKEDVFWWMGGDEMQGFEKNQDIIMDNGGHKEFRLSFGVLNVDTDKLCKKFIKKESNLLKHLLKFYESVDVKVIISEYWS